MDLLLRKCTNGTTADWTVNNYEEETVSVNTWMWWGWAGGRCEV